MREKNVKNSWQIFLPDQYKMYNRRKRKSANDLWADVHWSLAKHLEDPKQERGLTLINSCAMSARSTSSSFARSAS